MAAIIAIVYTLTVILAIVTVLAHCVAIFWPRKRLTTHVDPEGRPIVWRNEESAKKDVACVWWDDEIPPRPEPANGHVETKVASFSEAVRPLGQEPAISQRSVA